MALVDGVTPLNAANVPQKSGVDTITGQWAVTKPLATPGGFNFTKNGDVETWNAGATVAPTDWTLVGAGATIARDAATQKVSLFAAAVTRVGTDCYLSQRVDQNAGPVALWQSKPVVLGAWVKCAAATRARIGIYDGTSVQFSAYHSGGGAYEFLSVAITLGAGITQVEIRLQIDTGNTSATFDGIVFALGSGLTGDFWPSGLVTTPAAAGASAAAIVPPPKGLYASHDPRTLTGAKSAVMLNRCDEITMTDGTKVTATLGGMTADLTVAGAGGLDTGAENANAWYGAYLIRKSSDGTKALLLHREPYYSLNTNYETGPDGFHMLRRATGPVNTKLAQGFQVGATATLPFIALKLIRLGAIAAATKIWVTIESDAAGKPSGTVLATSDEVEAVRFPTTGTSHWFVFGFRVPPSLTASTQYHIVLQGDYTASDTLNIQWHADTTASTYANGSKAFYDGAVWTLDATQDFMFRAYIDQGTPTLTLPGGGYDQQSALLWLFRNNAGGDISKFAVTGRRHFQGPSNQDKVACVLNSTLETCSDANDVSAIVPPRPVLACYSMTSQTARSLAIGHHSAVDLDSSQGTAPAREMSRISYVGVGSTVGPNIEMPMILTEFQYLQVASYYQVDVYQSTFELVGT